MPDPNPTHHVVVKDETLSEIAARYGCTVEELAEANGLSNPNEIAAGQTLVLPGGDPDVSNLGPYGFADPATDPASPSAGLYGPFRSDMFSWIPPTESGQKCPFAKAPPCCVNDLTITCEHKRQFKLKPPFSQTNANKEQLIQVLGEKDDCDTMKIELSGGPCNRGKPTGSGKGKELAAPGDGVGKYPAVKIGDVTGLSPFKAKMPGPESRPAYEPVILTEFLQMLSPDSDYVKKVHSGSVQCCQGGDPFDYRVEVFADRGWDGFIELGFNFGTASDVVQYNELDSEGNVLPGPPKEARIYKVSDETTFKVGGSLTVKNGQRNTTVKLPDYRAKSKASSSAEKKAFAGLKDFFEKTLPNMNKMFSSSLVKIEPRWPSLKFGGGIKKVESAKSYKVMDQGQVYFKADPLIGIQGSTDILDWIILFCVSAAASPATAKLLLKIKAKAAEGGGGERFGGKAVIGIFFTVGGQVGGELVYDFIPDEPDKLTGKISGGIDFTLEGKASVEVRMFFVGVEAGASFKGKTGLGCFIEPSMQGWDPSLKGGLSFDGLILTAIAYASASGSRTGNKRAARRDMNKKRGFDATSGAGAKETNEGWRCVLLPPGKWPNPDTPANLCKPGTV